MLSWLSKETACLFGKVCHGEASSKEPTWYETRTEHQERITRELLDQLRNMPSHFLDPSVEMEDTNERLGRLLSLCWEASWVPKVSGRDAIWQ